LENTLKNPDAIAPDDAPTESKSPKYTLISNDARFSPGQIVATPGALALMQRTKTNPALLLNRHLHGDWGDICSEDAMLNEQALADGSRILSSFRVVADSELKILTPNQRAIADTHVWVITNSAMESAAPDLRHVTTFLLPSEY
jgi:hypothetical protein